MAKIRAIFEFESTDETYGSAWERYDLDARRDAIHSVIEAVEVRKGQRGRKGLDPSRVTIHWDNDPGDFD